MKAAVEIGVSQGTLKKWEYEGKIQPKRTQGGTRRYSMAILKPYLMRQG
ncbi:MAG: MerR family transcriptional regulator [Candidatus Marithrix sp.]